MTGQSSVLGRVRETLGGHASHRHPEPAVPLRLPRRAAATVGPAVIQPAQGGHPCPGSGWADP